MNFDFNNECKNEIKDNNEKPCSWTRNKFSRKIDFKAVWLHNGHADSVEVNTLIIKSQYKQPRILCKKEQSGD